MKQARNTKQFLKYFIPDYLAAVISWTLFYLFRKEYIGSTIYGYEYSITLDKAYYMGVIIVPLFWVLLYYLNGEYRRVFKKSRLQEIGNTIFATTLGVILIFFALILDDEIHSYKNYYQSFAFLWVVHFALTYVPRLITTTKTAHLIQSRSIGFNTLIIGSNQEALEVYEEYLQGAKSAGNRFVGFITINGDSTDPLSDHLPYLGKISNLQELVKEHKIEEVIIAIEPSERAKIQMILIKAKSCDVTIKAIPDLLDILSGTVRMSSLFGVPLVELSHGVMPVWQESTKRAIDVFFSMLALIILSPFFIVIAIIIKATSKGAVFYTHERIGRYGKPFSIYKFRSMYIDAEKHGPALSKDDDPRVTSIGRFMRKTRVDELPQFFNVIKGDMSLVGPRPERQFFINQIVERAPEYQLLMKVRPGITSWGQVKYGYAENVDEMIERLRYDIIYIENMSLYVDLKIMIYTIKTVFEGSGK